MGNLILNNLPGSNPGIDHAVFYSTEAGIGDRILFISGGSGGSGGGNLLITGIPLGSDPEITNAIWGLPDSLGAPPWYLVKSVGPNPSPGGYLIWNNIPNEDPGVPNAVYQLAQGGILYLFLSTGGGPSPMITYSHVELEALWVANGGSTADMTCAACGGVSKSIQNVAAAIAEAESGGCTYSLNAPPATGSYSWITQPGDGVCTWDYSGPGNLSVGLWQINRWGATSMTDTTNGEHATWSITDLYDADTNAQAAISISGDGSDFSAWSTFGSGAYCAFLA